MNNSNRDDDRFNKLYELLGDEVNTIYDTKQENEIFTDDTNNSFNDVYNIFNNQVENNNNNDITSEIFIEPTKIDINDKINSVKDNKFNKFNDLVKPFDTTRGKEIKNKINANKQVVFDDGLDIDTDNEKKLLNILSNQKFLYVIAVCLFISVTILTVKAIRFKKVVDNYDNYVAEEDSNIKVYEDNNNEIYKGGRASELVNCISKPIGTDNLPDNIKSIINQINNYYRSSGSYFAFTYKDIFTGFTVSYNENGAVFAASTVKAPVNIYLYEMAAEGKVNLNDELTYTRSYYNNGTGVLKNEPFDTTYTIRTLSEYAIRNSDNAAHNMLMDKYGRTNMLSFWKEKGTNAIFTNNNNWGVTNGHDALIYMEELYPSEKLQLKGHAYTYFNYNG